MGYLRKALALSSPDSVHMQTKILLRRAAKIEFLKQHGFDLKSHEQIQIDLKKKLSTLNKLAITQKVSKEDRLDTKSLLADMKRMSESDAILDLKSLFVPDHFLCLIKGDLMTEPVTIASGRTFDRQSIEQYFAV